MKIQSLDTNTGEFCSETFLKSTPPPPTPAVYGGQREIVLLWFCPCMASRGTQIEAAQYMW
jgi:hypothetical protein